MVASAVILLILGTVFVIAGLRGRRINDHAICRKCRFDLVGVYPEHARCPECGQELRSGRDVRIGGRRTMRRLTTAGLVLVVLALCAAGIGVLEWRTGYTFNRHKPVWLLALDGRSLIPSRAEAGAEELLDRLRAGQLSDRRISSLARTAVRVHARPFGPWADGWGDIIQDAWRLRKVEPELFVRYVRQSARPTLRVRPRVRAGAAIPIELRFRPRVGDRSRPSAAQPIVFAEPTSVVIDGQAVPFGDHLSLRGESRTIGRYLHLNNTRPSELSVGAEADLAPGDHTVRVEWLMSARDPGSIQRELDSWTVEAEARFRVVAADTELVTLVPDASLQSAFETAFGTPRVTAVVDPDGALRGILQFATTPLPANAAFGVLCEVDGVEMPAGWLGCRVGGFPVSGMSGVLLNERPESITVILRASARAAEHVVGLDEIWDGEVRFEDVPVAGDRP